jgi:hypothetical protein
MQLQFHAFLTAALDGGKWSTSRPGRFTTGEQPLVSTGHEVGWAPEPVWTRWRRKSYYCPSGESNPSRSAYNLVSILSGLPRFLGTVITTYLPTYLLTHSLTPCCRILLEKLTVTQLVKYYPVFFMEPEGSLPCSQKPATGPYLSQPFPFRPIDPCLPKVHLNVILPPTPRSSQWSLTFGPPNQNPVNTSPLHPACHMSCPPHPL